ncbi:hypothetical protein GCM10022419_111970 [Nonomuraea rosea]|uniref:Uncharacterized protein n=1 Tax=Nonomuraea rosea TaxID=638574 RepID=A0ABP6ZG47_9ACTN
MRVRVKVVLTLMGALFLFVLANRDADGIWSLVLFIFLAYLLFVFTSDDSPAGGGSDGGAGYDGGGRGGDGGWGDGGDGGE